MKPGIATRVKLLIHSLTVNDKSNAAEYSDPEEPKKTNDKFRLYGIAALLSLAMPWGVGPFFSNLSSGGRNFSWHLFTFSWWKPHFTAAPGRWEFGCLIDFSDLARAQISVFMVSLFLLTLTGGFLLLLRKKTGGVLLLLSAAVWEIAALVVLYCSPFPLHPVYYQISVYPVGAALAAIIGYKTLKLKGKY